MADALRDHRDDGEARARRFLFIAFYLAAEVVVLAALTALLLLVPPPHTAHLYALIATITPLLLIALVVETHGAPFRIDELAFAMDELALAGPADRAEARDERIARLIERTRDLGDEEMARELERMQVLDAAGRLTTMNRLELEQALAGFLIFAWPVVLLYVALGEGAALYAAGWAVSNRVVLALSVAPLVALAALFLTVAVAVFVKRVSRVE